MDSLPVSVVSAAAHPGSPTAGIQEAINALPEEGGMVFVPRGTHRIRRSIVLRSGVTLRGEGAATVLTRPAPVVFELTETAPAEKMEAALSTTDGLRPGDEIWFADSTQGGWHSRHIVIRAISGTKVEGALVAGDPKRSYDPEGGAWGGNFFPMLHVPKSEGVTVEAITIDGGGHAYDVGRIPDFTCAALHAVGAETLRVCNVTVRRWPGDGIGLQNGTGIVAGCVVEDCLGNGFHPGTSIRQSIWTHNIGRRNGWDGLYFCQKVRNAIVANNVFTDNSRNGIGGLSDPDAYNVVIGNVIARNGRRGIEAPQALGNVIADNLIQDNSQAGAGVFPGIGINHHAGNLVAGNACFDTQKQPTQSIGIEALDAVGENLIAGNYAPAYPGVAQANLPRGEIRAMTAPPVLDGRLDDAVWKQADPLLISRFNPDGKPAAVTAEVRLLYDARNLYVGVHCAEPLADRIRDKVRTRGGSAWMENDIELFLDPGTQGKRCFQFVVNSLGAVFEMQCAGTGGPWDSRGQAATHRGVDFWSAEMVIPLDALDAQELKPGQEWKANFGRMRTVCFPPEQTAWSPTLGSFYFPRRFGTLVVR